jgi:hypothetical protein
LNFIYKKENSLILQATGAPNFFGQKCCGLLTADIYLSLCMMILGEVFVGTSGMSKVSSSCCLGFFIYLFIYFVMFAFVFFALFFYFLCCVA